MPPKRILVTSELFLAHARSQDSELRQTSQNWSKCIHDYLEQHLAETESVRREPSLPPQKLLLKTPAMCL